MGRSMEPWMAMARWFALAALGVTLAMGAALPEISAASGITEYDIGMGKNGLGDLAVGSEGTVWFDENYTNEIGKLAPDGSVTRLALPTQRETAIINTLVAAPDGGVWFTEYAAKQIGRIAPDGTIVEYPFDTGKGFLPAPAAGPDGSVWFAEPGPKRVGRITPDGTISHFAADPAPYYLAVGPDGNMWFTISQNGALVADKIGTITPFGALSYVNLSGSATGKVVFGPAGAFWTILGGQSCGHSACSFLYRVTPAGQVTLFGDDTLRSNPGSIAAGKDGSLWIGFSTNRIARIAPTGQIAEYALPDANFALDDIAAGPDGRVWFTERHTRDEYGRIGRLDPATATPLPDAPDFPPAAVAGIPAAGPATVTPPTGKAVAPSCADIIPNTAITVPSFQEQRLAGDTLAPNFWGPAFTRPFPDEYRTASGSPRTVQYFDKGRMEQTDTTLTSGLLAMELITGQVQTSDTTFVPRPAPQIPIAGDPDGGGITYATLGGNDVQLLAPTDQRTRTDRTLGALVEQTIAADGTIVGENRNAGTGPLSLSIYDTVTRHNVPETFAQYRDRVGLLNVGYARSEPFLTHVKVAGVSRQVMVQVFERRVLTYTADNPAAYRVEMGNIGQHYFRWRYCGIS